MENYIFWVKGEQQSPRQISFKFRSASLCGTPKGPMWSIWHIPICVLQKLGLRTLEVQIVGRSRFPGISDMDFECVTSVSFWYDVIRSNAVQSDVRGLQTWKVSVCGLPLLRDYDLTFTCWGSDNDGESINLSSHLKKSILWVESIVRNLKDECCKVQSCSSFTTT